MNLRQLRRTAGTGEAVSCFQALNWRSHDSLMIEILHDRICQDPRNDDMTLYAKTLELMVVKYILSELIL